jgi:outer membrane protein assembly factor BamB
VCDINNTIFILTNKNTVYAISQSGKLLWKTLIPLQGIFGMSPSIADGKLFIPTWVTDRKIFIIE